MRGGFQDQGGLFSYISPEERVPASHPLRKVRELVREVLTALNRSFAKLYSHEGRPSIPPEQLLSALLLQALYGIRSERQLMEQADYNPLSRWFVGLSPDDRVWDSTTFTKNRERLQRGEMLQEFMAKLLDHPKVRPLLSDDHFSVDGTLIEAWASHKSFKPKGGDKADDGSNFHGQTRKNDTHASTSDPDALSQGQASRRRSRQRRPGGQGKRLGPGGRRNSHTGQRHGRTACFRGDAKTQGKVRRPAHNGGRGQGL